MARLFNEGGIGSRHDLGVDEAGIMQLLPHILQGRDNPFFGIIRIAADSGGDKDAVSVFDRFAHGHFRHLTGLVAVAVAPLVAAAAAAIGAVEGAVVGNEYLRYFGRCRPGGDIGENRGVGDAGMVLIPIVRHVVTGVLLHQMELLFSIRKRLKVYGGHKIPPLYIW